MLKYLISVGVALTKALFPAQKIRIQAFTVRKIAVYNSEGIKLTKCFLVLQKYSLNSAKK